MHLHLIGFLYFIGKLDRCIIVYCFSNILLMKRVMCGLCLMINISCQLFFRDSFIRLILSEIGKIYIQINYC